MNLPFRRRSRPKGAAGLALAGDFPDTGADDPPAWHDQPATQPETRPAA